MNILIQKFGGTSVANEQCREMVVQKIINAKSQGFSPVVVVSAMGRKGHPYATDTLISLVKSVYSGISKRELDLIMSCGEIISCCVLSATLKAKGLCSIALTGGQAGIITDDNFGSASILKVNTDYLYKLLEQGIIPVVAGFQGATENGLITTIGRGGSDITAAVLGKSLKADEVQIYTDVNGIMTADPKIVPDAKVIESMGYNEVFQFADEGAKVINPKAVEFAMKGNIPLVIKNVMSDAPGTIIANKYNGKTDKNLITGITYMLNRTQIFIEESGNNHIDDDILFSTFAENGLSIDLINVCPLYIAFTVDSDSTEKAESILEKLNLKFSIIRNCSKISIIGNGIRGIPGIMARIIRILRQNNIKILQTSDSHTTIWCLVKSEDTSKAIIVLHNEFNLSK